jgi:hypothetical protein
MNNDCMREAAQQRHEWAEAAAARCREVLAEASNLRTEG